MQNLKALMVGTVLGTAAISGVAQAEVSANIGVASEYVFRGLQASNGAQVFGGVDWESDNSGLYAGTWVSNASAANATEVDLYGGYAFKLTDALSLDLGYIAYLYPSSPEGVASHGNNSEIYAGLAGANWSTTLWYNFGADSVEDDEQLYLEGNIEFPLQGKFSLGLHLGYHLGTGDAYDVAGSDDDFFDYGVSFNAGDFSLAITNTTLDDGPNALGGSNKDRPIVTVSWSKSWDGLAK